jgi:hypothetical protein
MLGQTFDLVAASGQILRFSLLISLLAGNLVRRPVRTGLRRQPNLFLENSILRAFGDVLKRRFHVASCCKKFPSNFNGHQSMPEAPRNMDATWRRPRGERYAFKDEVAIAGIAPQFARDVLLEFFGYVRARMTACAFEDVHSAERKGNNVLVGKRHVPPPAINAGASRRNPGRSVCHAMIRELNVICGMGASGCAGPSSIRRSSPSPADPEDGMPGLGPSGDDPSREY